MRQLLLDRGRAARSERNRSLSIGNASTSKLPWYALIDATRHCACRVLDRTATILCSCYAQTDPEAKAPDRMVQVIGQSAGE